MELKVTTLTHEVPMAEFIENCVDVPRFMGACASCGGYGKRWACPPYDFDPAGIWERYSSILLYCKHIEIPESMREKTYEPDELAETYNGIFSRVKAEMLDELFALEAEREGSLALSAGGCDICARCARQDGLPCIRPEKMRWSVESIGGDVVKSLRDYFGLEIEWAKDGKLPGHFNLLGGLLIK
jgi:predicted metal-binding protein